MAAVDIEFDMYRYHGRSVPGHPAMGFLRNMYHSLIQQIIRQDPVYYSLIVALRSDSNYRLVSYPYVTKNSVVGDRTGFLHMDLDIQEYIRSKQGINLFTGSVSLDDEDDKTCTLIVPGFHDHIEDWYKCLDTRGEVPAGATTDCSLKKYTSVDRKRWGFPIPRPCPSHGVQISRSEIPHGASKTSSRQRRVVYPQLVGVNPDCKTLEIKDQLTVDEISVCHRDLLAPYYGVNGQKMTHSLPIGRFPASLIVENVYPLGDALLAKRRWDDPEVLEMHDILLGSDDDAAWRLIQEVRSMLVEKYLKAFKKLEALERKMFGINSYFLNKDKSLASKRS
jgi:hypothetical protein